MEKPHPASYDPVFDSSDSGASTLGEMENDNLLSHQKSNFHLQSRRKLFVLWSWAAAFFVGLLLVLNIAILTLQMQTQPVARVDLPYYLRNPAGQVYPNKVSRTYWDFDDNFLDHNISNAQIFWKGLFPEGDGIVALSDDEVHELDLVQSARSFHDASKSIYLVAGFHQLHCLSQLRSLIIKLHLDPSFSITDPTYYHTMHCVDVVRQQIMCHADGTLIYKRPEDKYPGDGAIRTCNNFDALTTWTKEHAYLSFPQDANLFPSHQT
ncbi:hypothetical protein G3M48_003153 [Beauveria asiatica]|uniref:Tat pathway signal sequence n=1 Tax=Beauveria asiatica TaxID=1069075 RepID=A0AAW0RWM6_9HYPO